MNNARKLRGFTLVEIAIVIAILAIVMGATLPKLIDIYAEFKLAGAAKTLAAHLEYLKQSTITEQVNRVADFNGSTYTIAGLKDPVNPEAGDIAGPAYGEVTTTANLAFDLGGSPTDGSGGLKTTDLVLTITDGERSHTVTITAYTGFIEVN